MSNISKIENFLLGVLYTLMEKNSIDDIDNINLLHIIHEEQRNPSGNKKIESAIELILSLINKDTKIIYCCECGLPNRQNNNLRFDKDKKNFVLKNEINPDDKVSNAYLTFIAENAAAKYEYMRKKI